MSPEQQAELEDQDPQAEEVNYDREDQDKTYFNSDTTRAIWRSLMKDGIRDQTGSHVGKTIVFARSHRHALHLADVFDELYPQYGSTFCRVIDNHESRAEQLIDDFKNPNNELTIAISVDMLDTGIDVREVVNLVFARPVRSYVKFWQMIGRGTRLCKDLFGPGRHKTEFLIFDHWQNFWFFSEKYKEVQPSPPKSLLQQLFEVRVELAQVALAKTDRDAFRVATTLISDDIRDVRKTGAIDVRDKWKELELLADADRIQHFTPATQKDLLSIVAPLQHLRNIRGDEDAYRFDLLISRLEVELLEGGPTAPKVQELRARVEATVELLPESQNPVREKSDVIAKVHSQDFWSNVNVNQLENVRHELRGIMKFQRLPPGGSVAPRVFDVTDDGLVAQAYTPRFEGLELAQYKQRVVSVLRERFADNPVLRRIRAGESVSNEQLEELATQMLQADAKADVKKLVGFDVEPRRSLLTVFRGLAGLDPEAVEKAFLSFVHKRPHLSSQQLRFLQMLQNYIAHNGGIEIERLYEPPFTTLHAESIDGLFQNTGDVDEILVILSLFEPKRVGPTEGPLAS